MTEEMMDELLKYIFMSATTTDEVSYLVSILQAAAGAKLLIGGKMSGADKETLRSEYEQLTRGLGAVAKYHVSTEDDGAIDEWVEACLGKFEVGYTLSV